MQLSGVRRLFEDRADATSDERRDVHKSKHAAEQKKPKLHRVGPDDGLHSPHVGVDEREDDKKQDSSKDWIAGTPAKQLVSQHQFNGDAGDINPHARRQSLANQKETTCCLPRSRSKSICEQLVW